MENTSYLLDHTTGSANMSTGPHSSDIGRNKFTSLTPWSEISPSEIVWNHGLSVKKKKSWSIIVPLGSDAAASGDCL